MGRTRAGSTIRPVSGLLVAASLSAALAGCGVPGAGGQYTHPPAELVDAVDCPGSFPYVPQAGSESELESQKPLPEAGSVPAGFEPRKAVRCSDTSPVTDEEGRWSAILEEHLTGDLAGLLDALEQPSDRAGPDLACTADMELVPELWLVDAAGQAIRAAWPTDACRKTKPGVRDALAALTVAESLTHRIKLIAPKAALDAGCPPSGALPLPGTTTLMPFPETTIEPKQNNDGGEGQSAPDSVDLLPDAEEVDAFQVCRYRVSSENAASGGEEEVPGLSDGQEFFDVIERVTGDFAAAGSLTGDDKDTLLAAIDSSHTAEDCNLPATGFAVLWPLLNDSPAGAPLTLELDGCDRLFVPGTRARTLPAELHTAVVHLLK